MRDEMDESRLETCVSIDVPVRWLWAKFDGRYNEKNTIMFDDLRRNFVMNPSAGLKIRPFRKAHMAGWRGFVNYFTLAPPMRLSRSTSLKSME